MVAESIDPTTVAYLVDKFGFPIGVAIVLLCVIVTLVMLIVRSIIIRQKLMDSYYFKNLDNKLDDHNKSLKEIHNELASVVVEMRCVSTKIDIYVNKLDRHFEPKNVAYVFREGKIGKIKNIQNIEEIDITKDIKRKVLSKTSH